MNRITHHIAPALAVTAGLLALASSPASGVITSGYVETQTFDSAASASAAGWQAANYQFVVPPDNIGHSATNNTLGSNGAGEGGGLMTRGGRTHYGDTTLSGTVNLSKRLEWNGEFAFTARSATFNTIGFGTSIGYFQAARDSDNRHVLSFTINEEGNTVPQQSQFRVLARTFLSDNTFAWQGGSEVATGPTAGTTWLTLQQGTPYYFNSVWDPTIGNGQHRLEFFDNTNPLSPVSVGVITATMTASVRNSAGFSATTFDSFGLRKLWGTIENGDTATMFIDNVSYTVTPEPSAALIGVFGSMLFVSARRRRAGVD